MAYALRWFAPMRDDASALEWHHFPRVPDRRARISAFIDHVRFLADQGQEPQRTWVAEGYVEKDELAEIAWIEKNRSLFSL